MPVGMWSNRNDYWLLVRIQNGTVTLEDSSATSYKTKHSLTGQSSSHRPMYLLGWVENSEPNRLHINVYGIFIYSLFRIAKDLEARNIIFIEVQLIYKVVLISAIQQSHSVTYIYIYIYIYINNTCTFLYSLPLWFIPGHWI